MHKGWNCKYADYLKKEHFGYCFLIHFIVEVNVNVTFHHLSFYQLNLNSL